MLNSAIAAITLIPASTISNMLPFPRISSELREGAIACAPIELDDLFAEFKPVVPVVMAHGRIQARLLSTDSRFRSRSVKRAAVDPICKEDGLFCSALSNTVG